MTLKFRTDDISVGTMTMLWAWHSKDRRCLIPKGRQDICLVSEAFRSALKPTLAIKWVQVAHSVV